PVFRTSPIGWKLTRAPSRGWPSRVTLPETVPTWRPSPHPRARPVRHNRSSRNRMAHLPGGKSAAARAGSIVRGRERLAAVDRGPGQEAVHVDAVADDRDVAVAQDEIDAAGVQAAPAVLALGDVRSDAAAGVIVGQQGGAIGVGARHAVEI